MGISELENGRWRLGDLVIDAGSQRIFRGEDTIELPQLSFRFLLALVRAAPSVLSIDDLMERVWPGIFVNPETVTQRAKLLRDALGDDPRNPRYFAVRRGVGYQLAEQPVAIGGDGNAAKPRPKWKHALAAVSLGVGQVCLVHHFDGEELIFELAHAATSAAIR